MTMAECFSPISDVLSDDASSTTTISSTYFLMSFNTLPIVFSSLKAGITAIIFSFLSLSIPLHNPHLSVFSSLANLLQH